MSIVRLDSGVYRCECDFSTSCYASCEVLGSEDCLLGHYCGIWYCYFGEY